MEDKLFKNIVAKFATGVCVITTSSGGHLYGFTANSFTSVSIDPLLVLFCLNKQAGSHDHFLTEDDYVINFLENSQKEICKIFASKSDDKFKNIDYYLSENKVPIIKGSLAHLEVKKHHIYDGGDHTIFLCRAVNGKHEDEKKPLIYFNRDFS